MSNKSKIEWTDATWNPVCGCTSVDLCYLAPPFNSNADYNVLFRAASGEAMSRA